MTLRNLMEIPPCVLQDIVPFGTLPTKRLMHPCLSICPTPGGHPSPCHQALTPAIKLGLEWLPGGHGVGWPCGGEGMGVCCSVSECPHF